MAFRVRSQGYQGYSFQPQGQGSEVLISFACRRNREAQWPKLKGERRKREKE